MGGGCTPPGVCDGEAETPVPPTPPPPSADAGAGGDAGAIADADTETDAVLPPATDLDFELFPPGDATPAAVAPATARVNSLGVDPPAAFEFGLEPRV